MMASELTRDEFKNWLLIYYERSSDGRNLEPAETTLLAHDAALRQRVEALEQERDQWKDKHEYLDYFFNSAITERNELRVAKQSLIDTKKALQRQLQEREETIERLQGWFDAVAASGVVDSSVQTSEEFIAWMKAQRARLAVLEGQYNELIMLVGKKFPGESRHETAKRYLQQHENECGQGGPCATREKGEG